MPYGARRTIASNGGVAKFGGLKPRTGQLEIRETARGKVLAARVRFNGERIRVRFGGEWEGWFREAGLSELGAKLDLG